MGAFAFSELVFIKEIAIGTALAVLVDAAVVRTFLFPALLGLLGGRAWWAPAWLGGGTEAGRRRGARARARAPQRMTGAPSRSTARSRACTTSSENWDPALSSSSSRAASGCMPGR